jgi:sugar phosphate isomerase/epimerase
MNLSRRNLLKLGVGAAAMCAVGTKVSNLRGDLPAKKIPIGLQMWSVRDVAQKDPARTLAAVAAMGYQGIECAGYYEMKADDLRKILDQNGLKCFGSHTGLNALTGDKLKDTVDFNKILGNKFLIVPSMPKANLASVAAMIDTAKQLTDISEQLKEFDMRVGYHNHTVEFKPVADRIPWEVIFGAAGPDVIMQLDINHCMDAGGDPIAVLKKFPHRTLTIHLTEHGGPQGAVIGEGTVPWKEIFELCETIGGTQCYIVEQEKYKKDQTTLDSVKECLQNLRKMGK